MDHQEHHKAQNVEIAIMWTIVTIPLLYGLYNAIKAAAQLFSG